MPNSATQIQILQEADLAFVDELVRDAGWNQLRADWLRIMTYEPRGCFAAFHNERLVGTVTTTTYGTDLGWIGMMLVHPEFRRQRIGTSLMQRSLSYLREVDVACIKLDATPEGYFVYEHLGFAAEWDFRRWERDGNNPPNPQSTNPTTTRDNPLDLRAFGANRSVLLDALDRESLTISTDDGFGMIRPGRRASYLGPVTARSLDAAKHIIGELLSDTGDPTFWDIPGQNIAAETLAESLGFRPVRKLTRMAIGKMQVDPHVGLQFAIAAPEMG